MHGSASGSENAKDVTKLQEDGLVMKHIRTMSVQVPAKAVAGIGLFEKIQVLLQNIAEFLDGLFGGGNPE
jgi:hypothetical protein